MTNDVVRSGKVSSINYAAGKIRVLYEDKSNSVTGELPLLSNEYDMPNVGDMVYVMHQSNGVESGVVSGKYFNANNQPVEFGPHIWRKDLGGGAFIRYDRNTKTLTVDVENISIVGNLYFDGNLMVGGDLSVSGTISATGTISASGDVTSGSISLQQHIHGTATDGPTTPPQ